MQLVKNGPDLPEGLLHLHEEGRVVFFCGAGISYPAALPGFKGLVEGIYNGLGTSTTRVEQAAIASEQYDTVLSLLDSRVVGGRIAVRRELAQVLTPDLTRATALQTHRSLLTLAKARSGQTRLITTNFDRVFEAVIQQDELAIARYQAPLLPVPKSRWDGLVYLHGLLSEPASDANLNTLVLSSGDFGLAYLTERWAARFSSELFRNYTICFVGYSINDPVMRYVMDALAADRLLGETPPEVFAFAGYSKDAQRAADEWRAKNVTPILYHSTPRHSYLHRTLKSWADLYRDGLIGKEGIVAAHATIEPRPSTVEDDVIGRVIWSLCDPSGLPARRFSELDPVRSLAWLDAFAADRYGHNDLSRFGVAANSQRDSKLSFSLVSRPTPYPRAPLMSFSQSDTPSVGWDDVMFELARWLLRHLDNPKLILWLAKRGGRLHPIFRGMIENELSKKPVSLRMMKLWRLVLAGKVRGR
jgi:hypothetical protein